MIIVSQDGKTIVNFNNIQAINVPKQNEKMIVAWFDVNENNKRDILLGIYKTEERAKEVLREIIDTYKSCNVETFSAGFGYVKNAVYEMSEE